LGLYISVSGCDSLLRRGSWRRARDVCQMCHGPSSWEHSAGEGDRVTRARRRGGRCSSPLAIAYGLCGEGAGRDGRIWEWKHCSPVGQGGAEKWLGKTETETETAMRMDGIRCGAVIVMSGANRRDQIPDQGPPCTNGQARLKEPLSQPLLALLHLS
jgi:hypothetical protein